MELDGDERAEKTQPQKDKELEVYRGPSSRSGYSRINYQLQNKVTVNWRIFRW